MAPIVAGRAPKGRNPMFARLDEDGDRFYHWQGEAFWSVTTMIGGGVPKWLHPHYAKMAADLALHEILAHGPHSRSSAIIRRLARAGREYVQQLKADGQLKTIKIERLTDLDFAARFVKGAADRHRDAAAELGREVHDEAEALVLQHARESARLYIRDLALEPWPERLAGHERSFHKFLEEWRPVYVAAEVTVFNRPQAYAGTLDAIVLLPAGEIVDAILRAGPVPDELAWLLGLDRDEMVEVIVDYKSGRQIYPEVALQLAAYSRAEFVAGADKVTEFPMPRVRLGAVLHLTPTRYRLLLTRIDEPIVTLFGNAREVFRWKKETGKTAFIADLRPAPSEEVA